MGTYIKLQFTRDMNKTTQEQWEDLQLWATGKYLNVEIDDYFIEIPEIRTPYSMANIEALIETIRDKIEGSGIIVELWDLEREPDEILHLTEEEK